MKAFEGSQCKSDQELLRENSRVTIGQVCVQGPLHWKRLKSIISIAAHKETFSIMHLVESRAYFRAKAQRPVPCDCRRSTEWAQMLENWSAEEEHVWHTRRREQLGVRLARACQKSGLPSWTQLKEFVLSQKASNSRYGTR